MNTEAHMSLFIFLFGLVYLSALVKRANDWLRSRPGMKLVSCESIEVKQKYSDSSGINAEKMTFFERGEHVNRFIRALR